MPVIIVALLRLAGDLLIGGLLLIGFFGVLAVWIVPVIWMHPVLAVGIGLLVLAFAKHRT